MAPQFRNQTTPAPGQVLQQLQEQIDEIFRALSSRGLLGLGGGGFGGTGGGGINPQRIQHGNAATDGGTGKVTITFSPAFPSAPDVVVAVGNSGTDLIIAEVESVSATQVVLSTSHVAQQGTAGLSTGPGTAHAHSPGTFVATPPAGATPVTSTSAQPAEPVSGVSANESSHTHPAPADNVPHNHGKSYVGGVTVYWIAML